MQIRDRIELRLEFPAPSAARIPTFDLKLPAFSFGLNAKLRQQSADGLYQLLEIDGLGKKC